MLEAEQFIEELTKLFITEETDPTLEVLNFYASKGFSFICEDGRIAKIEFDNKNKSA